MKRKHNPRGRADHKRRVDAVRQQAAADGLAELLGDIAADPEAGEWRGWAAGLLQGEQAPDEPKSGREK